MIRKWFNRGRKAPQEPHQTDESLYTNDTPPDATPLLNAGFVRLVDSIGDDSTVVKSARVSYGNETKGEEADHKLLKYLLKHHHETPFEHLSFTFHIRCPIFIARQWMRHRVGSFNEISGRYVELEHGFYHPANEGWLSWRQPDSVNKQSSNKGSWTSAGIQNLHHKYEEAIQASFEAYQSLLKSGVCREQARTVLPVGIYTEFYWTVNARSLFNFLRLRMDEAAQDEIRVYAYAILDLVKPLAPWTFEEFERIHNPVALQGESSYGEDESYIPPPVKQ